MNIEHRTLNIEVEEKEEEEKCWILNEEENEESAFFFDPRSMIYDLLSYLFYSRFFASIRGSKTLNESALRGRIALPGN
jgi:hypothetical protein